jgi:hypothetical protein
MTHGRAYLLLALAGLVGETAIFFALRALGARQGMVILAVLVWMMVVCYMVGVIGEALDRRDEEQRR